MGSAGRETVGAARGGDAGGVEWWRDPVVEQHIGEALLGSWEKGASDFGWETAGAAMSGDGGGVEWWRVAVVEQHSGEAFLGVDSERQ